MPRAGPSSRSAPPEQRLLEVIALQNESAEPENNLEEVLSVVVARAPGLTGADAGVVEFREGDEMVYRAVSGTAEPFLGLRLHIDESLSDRKSTRLNSSHANISYAVFCLKKKNHH